MKSTKKILQFLMLALLLVCQSEIYSQLSVNFSPALYGQSVDGLAYTQIVNTHSSSLLAKLTIRVRENRGRNVVVISIPPFVVQPGVNPINRVAFSNARFAFGNNNYGLTASQTGSFLEGEYEFCFEIDISESKNPSMAPVYENCFSQPVQPRTPLLLINPIDGDELCTRRPAFNWQPPAPLPLDARFRLILTVVKDKQDIVEALTFNPPIINQGNIPGNTLFYPPNAPELMEGMRYAWQVVVYSAATIIARSEAWTFVYKCSEKISSVNSESFRELKEFDDGNFYIASNHLRFTVMNPYSDGDLRYTIVRMSDPTVPIKGLPALKAVSGLNKYDVDLSEMNAFKNEEQYLLKVWLLNNRSLTLRFIYKDE